jgi:hypothetical protein
MDDKEDREVTLKEIEASLFKRMTDAMFDYNDWMKDHKQDFPEEYQLKAVIRWIP